MKARMMIGALMVSAVLCGQGFAADLLGHMVALNGGGCTACEPAAPCGDPCCDRCCRPCDLFAGLKGLFACNRCCDPCNACEAPQACSPAASRAAVSAAASRPANRRASPPASPLAIPASRAAVSAAASRPANRRASRPASPAASRAPVARRAPLDARSNAAGPAAVRCWTSWTTCWGSVA
jgi:hypothetical protein